MKGCVILVACVVGATAALTQYRTQPKKAYGPPPPPVHHADHRFDHHAHTDYHAAPHYNFEYSVHDGHTGDVKSQYETREGDTVKGYYTVKDPDGTTREVHYTADHKNGFNAEVKRTGHAGHPVRGPHHSKHDRHLPFTPSKSQINYRYNHVHKKRYFY